MIDGWFPHINFKGDIISGSSDIWLTPTVGDPSIIGKGTNPIWQELTPVWNRNNGTTQVGSEILSTAYNEYQGSDRTIWAGFNALGQGHLDVYRGISLIDSIQTGCAARFGREIFGYLYPYQDVYRHLIIDESEYTQGIITTFQIGGDQDIIVWQVATGTYTRQIWTKYLGINKQIDIRDDETPLKIFTEDNSPWMLSGTQVGTFIRPLNSSYGYLIAGDLYYPDARMLDGKLLVAGSYSNGSPRIIRIDFDTPRIDLRTIGNSIPPIPPKPEPIPPNPKPIPPKPIPESPKSAKFGKINKLKNMETEIVSLIAFDHYARVDGNKLIFDSLFETDFELSKPDDRFALMHEGKYVGVDSTLYSPDIRQQYYLTDKRQGYESFFVGTVEGSNLLVAFIQYFKDSGANNTDAFISVPLTLKVKK